MYGKTREEAVLILLGLREHVSLLVQHRRAGLFSHFRFSLCVVHRPRILNANVATPSNRFYSLFMSVRNSGL